MIEKSHLAANEIANLNVINAMTVSDAVLKMDSLRVTRLVVTDHNGVAIYDSASSGNLAEKYTLFPEVVKALDGNDVFSWNYHDGTMRSCAAVPIYSYGTLVGCIYMMEHDSQQGMLIKTLQNNILTITLILEFVLIVFSLVFSRVFTNRLRSIMASIRAVREGDYSHTMKLHGHDELNILSDEFNDLFARLQASENKRRQFVSDASHELKTPLASIKLLSDSILQNDMDIATVREFVSDIGNEAERLNRMSQKLLSLSKAESQEDPDAEIVFIAPTVRRVIRMLNAIAEKNNISIETDLQQDCSVLILEDDLYQIIFNLTENGIKYNTPGGKLHISLIRNQDDVILKFRDTGVGIPEDSLDNIFERFYRVDKARSRKSGGSGLGLSIVKSIVEHSGGQILVESQIGKGTVFTVSFPVFDTDFESQEG